MKTQRVFSLLLLLFLACAPSADAFRKQNRTSVSASYADVTVAEQDIPQVHYLVEMIGKELYGMVSKKKYKFYIYMTIGSLPSERATIVLISTICNTLYGLSILLGFIFFKRGPMLIFSVMTLWIGPAMVLILLGTVALMLAAFALYPITSVFVMILCFFMTSQLAQILGKKFGLDSDQDGDVDFLDLLHVLAGTKVGSCLGLMKLHDFLNQCKIDPFREINLRLDRIQRCTQLQNSISRRKVLDQMQKDVADAGNPPKKKKL